jgi:hypothetical protein
MASTSMPWRGLLVDGPPGDQAGGPFHPSASAGRGRGRASPSPSPYAFMRAATSYFVTAERRPGVSSAGIALSTSSPLA